MNDDSPDVTQLLIDWNHGDATVLDVLMPQIVDELRKVARKYLGGESDASTLQPTALVNEVYRTFYASIATVDADGLPHVTPIGSLLLHREPGRGFWFERFTTTMPRHLERDSHLCALAVDTRLQVWGRALIAGRFKTASGVRLKGVAGTRRAATEREVELFQRRVKLVRWTRGYKMLWSRFSSGREVTFDRVLPLRLGRMWPLRVDSDVA